MDHLLICYIEYSHIGTLFAYTIVICEYVNETPITVICFPAFHHECVKWLFECMRAYLRECYKMFKQNEIRIIGINYFKYTKWFIYIKRPMTYIYAKCVGTNMQSVAKWLVNDIPLIKYVVRAVPHCTLYWILLSYTKPMINARVSAFSINEMVDLVKKKNWIIFPETAGESRFLFLCSFLCCKSKLWSELSYASIVSKLHTTHI